MFNFLGTIAEYFLDLNRERTLEGLKTAAARCRMRRFYSLELATSLFGECGVVRHWGRIGSTGRIRTDWYDEAPEAENAIQIQIQSKLRREYTP